MSLILEAFGREVVKPLFYPHPNFNLGVWSWAPSGYRVYRYLITLGDGSQLISSIKLDVGANLFGRWADGTTTLYVVTNCEERT